MDENEKRIVEWLRGMEREASIAPYVEALREYLEKSDD